LIDRSLNYGRHLISAYLEASKPFHSVVDLGAGRGADLRLARAALAATQCYGVEVFAPYAKELASADFAVLQTDIEHESLPFSENSVDVIIANQILEHTKEVFWILHEISRVLRVGGSFILGLPNLASLHNRVLLCAGKQPTAIKTASAHVRGFTKGDVLHFLQCCFPGGYALRDFGGSNFYPFPPRPARMLATCFPTLAASIFFRLEKLRAYDTGFLDFPVGQAMQTNFYLGKSEVERKKAVA